MTTHRRLRTPQRILAVALTLLALGCSSRSTPVEPSDLEDSPPAFVGELSGRVLGIGGRPFAARVSSRGQVFVTQQDLNRVSQFPLSSGVLGKPRPVGADPGDVIFTSTGGTAIVSTFYGGALHLINVATGLMSQVVPIGTNAYRLAISGDNARIFVTTTGGKVYAVDRTRGKVVDSVQLAGSLQGISRRSSDGRLAVTSTSGGIWLLNPATLDVVISGAVPPSAQDIAYSLDGTEIFVALEDAGWVAVLNAATLALTDSIGFDAATPMRPFGLAVSPNGATLLVTSPAYGRIAVVNLATRTVTRMLSPGGVPRRVAFAPSGLAAVAANEGNWVDVLRD